MDIVKTLGDAKVIPVIVIEDEAQAVPLARALVKGGLPVLEVTFRTKAAAAAIAAIRREVPEAVVGAGTILTVEQLHAAKQAGAVFGVAPGFDPLIIAAAKARGVKFGRPPLPLPENFHDVHRDWRAKKVTLRQAAERCAMPEGTFYAKAVRLERGDAL